MQNDINMFSLLYMDGKPKFFLMQHRIFRRGDRASEVRAGIPYGP